MAKHIFVTGGVVSSLGKGITCASMAMLLERRGLKVRLQKFDPYLNVDPGTMNPAQHGEVYVLDDGTETDLDLGHYERFTNAEMDRHSNYTSGRIYQKIINKERHGDYLGQTIQVIPHVTDEIKQCIHLMAKPDTDVVITEIGGTVGDIEGLPFLEAIRQFALDVGKHNCLYVHLTLVPYLKAAQELKTKPTQHSVGMLRQIGIQPDLLICRTERDLSDDMRRKIGLFCNVEFHAVIAEKDKDFSVYEVPLSLHEKRLDDLIIEKFGFGQKVKPLDATDWLSMLSRKKNPKFEATIAVVGKYMETHDSYKSIYESLDHAGIANSTRVRIIKVDAEDLEDESRAESALSGMDGILVPGGFGDRGVEGKIVAVKYAREHNIPFFGVCLGMQCATIEFARNVLKLKDANSTEFTDERHQTHHPVICLMSEQEHVEDMGGTMRLGNYPCELAQGSKALEAYGQSSILERHRHRYEFNNKYRARYAEQGFVFSGLSPDGKLVEVVELKEHPWFVAVQYHPEFKSKPIQAHPLFRNFVRAARDRHKALSSGGAEGLTKETTQATMHKPEAPARDGIGERKANYAC
jgi:CTP synthase